MCVRPAEQIHQEHVTNDRLPGNAPAFPFGSHSAPMLSAFRTPHAIALPGLPARSAAPLRVVCQPSRRLPITNRKSQIAKSLICLMPFKSKAQRRKFAQLLVEGKISDETYEEWNRETGGRKLPERVTRKKPARKKPARRKKAARKKARR